MGSRLGVDLGTTWTAAALRTDNGVEAITLGTHTVAMPSVLAVEGDSVVAGEAAARRLANDPTAGAREVKRRLGDEHQIILAGTPYGAETLTGHLLKAVIETATSLNGTPPDEVVLTHPANWGEYKLDLLREAARVAGLGAVTLLSEPEAAALHYARLGKIAPGDAVAVYDFGGGTFDVAIVRTSAEGPELLGQAEGLERLGGIDLDQAVVIHVNGALDGKLQELDSSDPEVRRALERVRADCTVAKETLSTDADAQISVQVPGMSTDVRITREEFEAAIKPRLGETLAALDRAVAAAGLTNGDLAGILLVGGSSRIPIVA
jgi:molecular chaperone DnaK